MTGKTIAAQVRRSMSALGLVTVASAFAPPPPHVTLRMPRPTPNAATTRAEDVLAKSRAAYAALTSYADTGKIVVEYGSATSPARDVHTFRTYFKKPRWFYFDFQLGPTFGRAVLWTEPTKVHDWWQTTGNEDEYPIEKGTTPFITGTSPTYGTVVLIPALLFPRSALGGTFAELGEVTDAGMEAVDGRQCHKLEGYARSVYGSGREANRRRTTLWIDAETMLVRRVQEEWRPSVATTVNRRTVTLSPHANPALDDTHFRFTPPSAQH